MSEAGVLAALEQFVTLRRAVERGAVVGWQALDRDGVVVQEGRLPPPVQCNDRGVGWDLKLVASRPFVLAKVRWGTGSNGAEVAYAGILLAEGDAYDVHIFTGSEDEHPLVARDGLPCWRTLGERRRRNLLSRYAMQAGWVAVAGRVFGSTVERDAFMRMRRQHAALGRVIVAPELAVSGWMLALAERGTWRSGVPFSWMMVPDEDEVATETEG